MISNMFPVCNDYKPERSEKEHIIPSTGSLLFTVNYGREV